MSAKPVAILFTDTHLSRKNYETNESVYDQIFDLSDDLGVDILIHGGDVFDSRKSQPLDHLSFFRGVLNKAHERGKTIHGIPGNHDKTDYESSDSFLDPFEHYPAFELHREPDFFQIGDLFIYTLPYYDEKALYAEKLKVLQPDKDSTNLLITHIAVNGVKNNDHSLVENSIKKDLFSSYKQVLVGHYHDVDFINPNIYYFGAAFQHDFGEDDNKGVVIIYADGETKPEPIQFKKYLKISIDISDSTEKELEDLRDKYKESDDHVRFEFVGDSEALSAVDKNKYSDLGIDVKFKSNESEAAIKSAENEEFVSFNDESILEEFEDFCEKNEISEVDDGLDFLKKALKLNKLKE